MVRAAANVEVLKWARESLNLTIDDVARRMGRSSEEILAWESGKLLPTYVQLETLAYDVYKRPVAIFFFPEPPDEITLADSFRTLPDFELANLSPTVIKLIRRAQSLQLRLSDLCGGASPSDRNIVADLRLTHTTAVNRAADLLREYLGVPLEVQSSWRNADVAFKEWRNVIGDCGVFVFKEAFQQDEISGFCLYDEEFPIIYANNTLVETRQVFTLFHELAHLLLHTGGIAKIKDDYISALRPPERGVEVFCNKIVGAFLVPDADFAQRIRGLPIDDDHMSDLADYYCVSREVILRKLRDRRLVDQSTYDELAQRWRDQAGRKGGGREEGGGNWYANQRVYLGPKFIDIVLSAYYRNVIDIYGVAEHLGMKVDVARRFESHL